MLINIPLKLALMFTIGCSFFITTIQVMANEKLINKYDSILPSHSQLIHSQFSSKRSAYEANNQSHSVVTSLREEWYQDKNGEKWYAWEEKHENADGQWQPINMGVIKKGFMGYLVQPEVLLTQSE